MKTLPDYPCKPGGILLVGINPSPVSVTTGHYYQGAHGRRLWRRLAALGLLNGAVNGEEDTAFVAAGNGLTDLVKRPTPSAAKLTPVELRAGEVALGKKIARWRPGLVLFAYRPPAEHLLGKANVAPGRCPDLCGARTFLLTSPYAPADHAKRVNADLLAYLGQDAARTRSSSAKRGDRRGLRCPSISQSMVTTQRVTAADLASFRIRLPRAAKSLFPEARTVVRIRLRGRQLDARYDPRLGPDRERSAVLSFRRNALAAIRKDEVLHVRADSSGVLTLD